jgi:hypothetical protein
MVEAADLFLVVFEEFGAEVHSIKSKAAFGILNSTSFDVHFFDFEFFFQNAPAKAKTANFESKKLLIFASKQKSRSQSPRLTSSTSNSLV